MYNCFRLSNFTIHLSRKTKRKTLSETGDSSTNTRRGALDSYEGSVATQETIFEQSNDGKYQCRLTTLTTVDY